jgi:hypothetical protein
VRHVAVGARTLAFVAGSVEWIKVLKRQKRERKHRRWKCPFIAARVIKHRSVIACSQVRHEFACENRRFERSHLLLKEPWAGTEQFHVGMNIGAGKIGRDRCRHVASEVNPAVRIGRRSEGRLSQADQQPHEGHAFVGCCVDSFDSGGFRKQAAKTQKLESTAGHPHRDPWVVCQIETR